MAEFAQAVDRDGKHTGGSSGYNIAMLEAPEAGKRRDCARQR